MAEHYKVQLGQTIRARREELGLTQKDLAEKTHYKEGQTVSRWERGENLPSNLEAVAEALGWTLAQLVAGIEPPNRRAARQLGTPDLSKPEPSQLDQLQEQIAELRAAVDDLRQLVQQNHAKSLARVAAVLRRIDEAAPAKPPSQAPRRRSGSA